MTTRPSRSMVTMGVTESMSFSRAGLACLPWLDQAPRSCQRGVTGGANGHHGVVPSSSDADDPGARPLTRGYRRETRWAMADRHDLKRFLEAQGTCLRAGAAGAQGRSQTQPLDVVHLSADRRALGSSVHVERFAIASLAETRAYLEHPVLGARLRECAQLTNAVRGRTAEEIFGPRRCREAAVVDDPLRASQPG